MRNIVCPHCQQAVQVLDALEQAHCVRCGQGLGPVNTQFTATPSALASQAIQPIDQFERNDDESPRAFTDWDEFRATSPAVQQELLELARRPMPDLRNVYLRPLPPDLPESMERWKRPLGTIEGGGERFVNIWTLGCLVSLGVALCVFVPTAARLMGVAFVPREVAVVGLAITGVSIWYFLARRHKPKYALWVFEEGIFWQGRWHNKGSTSWKDVQRFQVAVNPVTRMPIYWLTVADNIRFDIEIDRAPALIPLLEFMEIRLTASQLLPRLEKIYAGQSVGFGGVQLDRQGLTRGKFFAPWSQIERVLRDREQLFVHVRGRADWLSIPYAGVSFPLVVMAIAHVLIAEETESGPSEPEA
jgi:hypothetical protein